MFYVPRNTTGEYLNLDRTVTSWVTVSTPQNGIDWVIFLQEIQKTYTITKILEYIVTLVGLAGNAVVFRLLSFHIKRNAFSVYILNLAAADFVFLFIWMTLSIRSLSTELELYNEHTLLFLNLNIFPYIASLSIITAISIERCLSVLQPIWYYSHRPKYLSAVVCALLWALSLLLSILTLEFSGFLSGKRDEYLSELTDLSIATWLIFSFVLLFVSSLVLLTRLLCGSRKRKPTRLYVIIGLTVLVFLICGLPWGICWFLLNWMPIWNNIHIFRFHLVTEVLSCVNSCANPIIYFFVGSYRKQKIQHRRSLKVILQRALQDIPGENGSDGHPPQETLEMSGRSNDSHLRVML
uniref:Mas-related G protein-coupled receptor G2 n=1 Tax=Sorex araneus TaxID=42254 RepID=W8W3H5_SORAR|nr:TPA: Mas-related G protein-coupled receptor G2 [Sorex araneus]